MAEQVVNHKCPNCLAPLYFDGTTGKMQCDFCRSSFEVAEIESMYSEQAAQAAQAMANGSAEDPEENWGNAGQGMKVYSCPSCGAELICSETTAASCCPYCGNQTVIPGQFTGSIKPDYIIPFKTDKEAAKKALTEHYKGKKLLPKTFAESNHIEEIQGVYVPFWLYDCVTEGKMEFAAEKTIVTENSKERVERTERYTVYRDGTVAFEKVPADASKRMPDEHMDSIEPFDYSELKPFSTIYLPGFLADKYDEDADTCRPRIEQRCADATAQMIRNTVTGYDSVMVKSSDVEFSHGSVQYALFPVWLLSTKWEGTNYLFAMNGQSGRLIGDLPVDKGKYWFYFIRNFIIVLAIMILLNVVALGLSGLAFVLCCCVIVPVLAAFLMGAVLKSSMRSVRTKNAAHYTTSELRLSVNDDIYKDTSTRTITKN